MANEQLPRPGIEVIQQFRSASPTIVRPTLRPCVVGPAKEVIEVTTADGLLNSQAKQGTYEQLPKTIAQSSFPSPRGNIAEVNVEEDTIRAFLLNGGLLQELERDPGDSFLRSWNKAAAATLRTLKISAAAGIDITGMIAPTIVLAVDVPARANTTEDVVITFVSNNTTLLATQIRDQINNAVGEDIATVVDIGGGFVKVKLTSPTYGALSSLTVRKGGSFNVSLGFAPDTETRIEGSGFRGQDQNNNTTLTPWVEWFRGEYYVEGVVTVFPTETDLLFGVGLTDRAGVYTTAKATSLTFTGSGSIDLRVGDEFWADGIKPNNSRLMKVEATRFKLGTVNTRLSTYSATGKLVTAVYDPSNINTLFASVPFSPCYGWFRAKNLTINLNAAAAYLLGTTLGMPAEQAIITGSGAITLPVALAGLNLKFVVTVDGVEGEEQTFTFTGGPFADVAAIATAIGDHITGVVATAADATHIRFATTRTGATQELKLVGTSTALVSLGFAAATDVNAVGKDVEFRDVVPTLKSSVVDLGNIATRTLKIQLSGDADTVTPTWTTTKTHTFGAGPFADLGALVTDILNDAPFIAVDPATGLGLTAEVGDPLGTPYLLIKGAWSGSVAASTKGLQFDPTSTCKATPPVSLDFDPAGGGIAMDVGEENLAGLIFKFRLNSRPKIYQAVFISDSLVDAVTAINEAAGIPVASIGGLLENQIKLTSTLKGYASLMEVVTDAHPSGVQPSSRRSAAALGFNIVGQTSEGTGTAGTGRPNPDFYIDISGSAVLGAEILRSTQTGIPFNPGISDTYIQYIGLRRDLSSAAVHPGLLALSDTTTLTSVLGPVNKLNPLGLGMFFEMINAPALECTGLGVDETSAGEPYGTPLAYTKALTYLQAQEVYALAPLTHSETVAQAFMTHTLLMSQPDRKGERIVFFNPTMPTRAVDDIMASGLSGNTTATEDEFVGDVNPTAALIAHSIDPSEEIPVSADLYVELAVGSEVRRYSVKQVNGVVFTFRTTFAAGENADAFFTVTALNVPLVNVDWKMAIRGLPLTIPGSSLPDYDAIAATVQKKCIAYKQRRMYYVFPDKVKALIGGTEELLEGFYMGAAYAGLVAAQPPQQGFTNLPVAGFSGVAGSNDTFDENQLSVMAYGGCFIVIQDVQGAPLSCRHQLSTNTTSIETRELSITKVVDYVAKFLRIGLRTFIGTFNITQPFLDTLSTVIHGMLSFLEENGIIISGDLNNLIQSKDQPDTVLVDITLDVPYPCNYIRLTLAI